MKHASDPRFPAVRSPATFPRPDARGAFTLVELLAVMIVGGILLGLAVPLLTSSDAVPRGTVMLTDAFQQARAYAMANNTFVYVGIAELDVTQDASVKPQVPGVGRLVVATVAARDGNRDYDTSQPTTTWSSGYNNGANLIALGNLRRLDNIHLADQLADPATGPMNRPVMANDRYRLGNSGANSQAATPFAWPLGSPLTGGYQYLFTKTVQFDPQGVARMQFADNAARIDLYVEACLQSTHGTTVAANAQTAAVQVDCMTGAVRIYRP